MRRQRRSGPDAGESSDGGSIVLAVGRLQPSTPGLLSARGGTLSRYGGSAEGIGGEAVVLHRYGGSEAKQGVFGMLLLDPHDAIIRDGCAEALPAASRVRVRRIRARPLRAPSNGRRGQLVSSVCQRRRAPLETLGGISAAQAYHHRLLRRPPVRTVAPGAESELVARSLNSVVRSTSGSSKNGAGDGSTAAPGGTSGSCTLSILLLPRRYRLAISYLFGFG